MRHLTFTRAEWVTMSPRVFAPAAGFIDLKMGYAPELRPWQWMIMAK
jgi:hypothetical protein